jgi:2,4-dienoyl-CoA reductase-like NADH-dependent reductase (Old Yellow Enzyme family)
MPNLFEPIDFRSLTLRHRIVVSPMCQYSSVERPGERLAPRAPRLAACRRGGAGLHRGGGRDPRRADQPQDLGIWSDEQIPGCAASPTSSTHKGALAGVQLAHAGRKASTLAPWFGEGTVTPPEGGWEPVGPTSEPFAPSYPTPRVLTASEINGVVRAFEAATLRARDAGFDVIEVHAAHGYLLHEFLSPLVNTRTDEYGGSFDNRVRLTIDVADAVRRAWPDELPVFVRISATDWVEGGWDLDQSWNWLAASAPSGST